MTDSFFLRVESRVERLAEIAEFVETAARAAGLNDEQVYDVQMAVDEACTNVIEHAYHGDPHGSLELTCATRGKEWVITIRDFGARFDPQKVKMPKTGDPLSKRRIGGLGIFFMHKLMDRVTYDFSEGAGNCVTMIKKLGK